MVLSIATEFIENEKEDVCKQDCERNAFKRLAEKLKSRYSRLPICQLVKFNVENLNEIQKNKLKLFTRQS